MRTITREQIEKYNQMVKASVGTEAYDKLALPCEYKDEDTKRWIGNPYGYIYQIPASFDDAEYYIKTVCGIPYVYMALDGELTDRCCLEGKEIARLFFGV